MSSIHTERAKRWRTTPFMAEWLANTVDYCKNTPEGQLGFRQWLLHRYGPDTDTTNLVQATLKPPRKDHSPPPSYGVIWNNAAVELGVSDEAIQLYDSYTMEAGLCSPPRTKPALKRRRAESSVEWLARRSEAARQGCKAPNIDWEVARAVALSEFDRTKDTIELWRTVPQSLFQTIMTRKASTIPSPQILNNSKEYIEFHTLDDAFRSRLYGLNLAHMMWSHAASLFEDLAQRGLTTASAIEREYKKDSQLMWRLIACVCYVRCLKRQFVGQLVQEFSWSEYFRPYFKRWRTTTGLSKIEPDFSYIGKHGYRNGIVDELIVRFCCDLEMTGSAAFFDRMTKFLDKDPSEANKFSAQAFAEMGDVAIIIDFQSQIEGSPFGQRLLKYAASKEASQLKDPHFVGELSFMDLTKIIWSDVGKSPDYETKAFVIARCVVSTWLRNVTSRQSIRNFFPYLFSVKTYTPLERLNPQAFDALWSEIDRNLWDAARIVDRSSTPGVVAQRFGLVNPDDPDKPSFCAWIFKALDPTRGARLVASTTPAPARNAEQSDIPVAGPQDSAVKSGHAYMAEQEAAKLKDKVKTRGVDGPSEVATEDIDEDQPEVEREVELPETMPFEFKIGKKIMKIFHRILELDPNEADAHNGPQKGQVRWGEFERAMKRVGFTTCQTAGSSVRFDPPAKTARPITFHRPHPDSIMTPYHIKLFVSHLFSP
ncbi:hypothetical protein FPV67DRAFT_1509726 [Lyophyllum atratum]|nr:hypothetical protein FPV67DRAFT_1509726 [Lyophyllum atratum]